jgi:tetratricopeptide (TPR) repeat protein
VSEQMQESLVQWRARMEQLAARREWSALLGESRAAAAVFPAAWEPPYYEGRALLEAGDYPRADQLLRQSMERFPTLAQFAVLYGYVGGRSLGAEGALERWEMLHAKLPDAPGPMIGLATAFRSAGSLDRADALLAEGVHRFPDHVPMLVQFADLAAQRQRWEAAIDRWAMVRRKAPDRVDAIAASIGSLRQANRLNEAEALAQEALQHFPDDPDLNTSHAALAIAREDWAAAAVSLRRVLAAMPANQPAAVGLMGALRRLGKPDEAEAVAKAALEHHPDNELLLREYAEVASRGERWADAVERWKAVYDRCPARPATYLGYIEALRRSEDMITAEEIASEGVGFAGDDRELLMKYAELATERGDVTEAQKRWQVVKRKFPDDATIQEAFSDNRRVINKLKNQSAKDAESAKLGPVRGSIKLAEKPQQPPRLAPVGPSALDLLLTGAPIVKPAASDPEPAPTGFGHKLRRLFGKS